MNRGVMDGEYSQGRRTHPHLRWRYELRALEAVAAYREFGSSQGSHRVLDLGAADGLTLLEIRRLLGGVGEFDGVELSADLLAQAERLPGDTRLILGDVMQLPDRLQPGSYDLVVALAVLEHLPNPLTCLRESHRMLRPGGVFVATCPNPFWDSAAGTFGLVADEYHEQRMPSERMIGLLKDVGFESVFFRPFMWAPIAMLPYVGVSVPAQTARRLEAPIRRLGVLNATFVNQLVSGRKPPALVNR